MLVALIGSVKQLQRAWEIGANWATTTRFVDQLSSLLLFVHSYCNSNLLGIAPNATMQLAQPIRSDIIGHRVCVRLCHHFDSFIYKLIFYSTKWSWITQSLMIHYLIAQQFYYNVMEFCICAAELRNKNEPTYLAAINIGLQTRLFSSFVCNNHGRLGNVCKNLYKYLNCTKKQNRLHCTTHPSKYLHLFDWPFFSVGMRRKKQLQC